MKTFTRLEKLGVASEINLSDAHPRQPLTETQNQIIQSLPSIFSKAARYPERQLEEKLVSLFAELSGQNRQVLLDRYFLSYAASCAISMVATLCRMRGYKVGLIEPCFDNIPDLLKHQGVPLQPIPEQIVFHSLSLQALDSLDIDVLWVVSPNNPTGVALNRSHLEGISSYCASRKILIVVDFCFRFFSDTMLEYDQYDVLLNSGTSFIAIEDTGKTWPTLDTKCGIVVSSEDMHESMYQAHDDLLLGVSPFSTALISEFIKDSLETGIENSLRHIPNHNRKNLVEALTQTSVVHVENLRSEIPLIWASITAEFSAVDLYKELVKRGVHVLPGNNFFWSDPAKGARYFRVSPLRSPALIAHALPLIRESLEVLQERTAVN